MENILFAAVLYIAVVSFLFWLTKPVTQSPRRPITQSPRRPVASPLSLDELHTAFAVEPEPDAEVMQEEVANPTPANIQIEDIKIEDIETLQLRPARKIAKQLGIQQKVNGKDQPLSWLRAQIKKRLEEEPQTTAPIIAEVLSVA
ncbi:MAG: hypothetical protein SVX43_21905 [Cyanobacteriota bacterium]|nr:hypothetical protein [Cyanobacteriota bacterium]